MLLVSVYQGCLLTELLINVPLKPMKTFAEFTASVQNGRYTLIIYNESDAATYIETSNSSQFVELRKALQIYPPIYVQTFDEVYENVRNAPGIFMSTDEPEMRMLAMDVRIIFECQ